MTSNFEPPDLRSHVLGRQRAASRAATLIYLGHWAGVITSIIGCAALAGYGLGLEAPWRPIAGGPATHPLTAISLIVCGLAVASMRPFRTPATAVAVLLAVALVAVLRIVELAAGLPILNYITPFPTTLAQEVSEGTPIQYGWNTAAMFILVAGTFLLRFRGQRRASQFVAAAGLYAPLVSLIGYAFGVAGFYGQMSLTTTIAGLFLTASPLLLSARTGIMRAICSPWDGGRFGRMEIAVITSVVFLGGLVLQHTDGTRAATLMPVLVAVTIVMASTTIAWCTIIVEKNDRRRRSAERTVLDLVLHDPLSGLYNRRFLKDQEGGLLAFAKRQRYQISVLMLDIDHFKAVNDNFGHPSGDIIIRRLAETIKGRIRRSDIAVRYGGEELLVVLLDTELETAWSVAEELRATIAAIDLSDSGLPPITVSIGVAEVTASLSEAIARADDALYRAKNSGRNRVVSDDARRGPVLVSA